VSCTQCLTIPVNQDGIRIPTADSIYTKRRASPSKRCSPPRRWPYSIWEPAAGRGAIVRVLRDAGHKVIASDIISRDFALDFEGDFLKQGHAPGDIELILTNPPYQYAEGFVAHALMLCPRVIMLCRLAFLESERRSHILDGGTLDGVHVFKKRLPMLHRDGWTGPRASSAIPFAWFCWSRDHVGPATIDRIDFPHVAG
jgi:hypothetical protein